MNTVWQEPEIARVVATLAPLEVYLVGGAVRDLLLGRPLKDYDLLIDCEPEHLLSLKPALKQATGRTVIVLDGQRGILRVCQRDKEGLDLCARQGETVEKDLARRDITFNAMALSARGELRDPFGGAADLAAKRVRVTSPQVLEDDPLRVLRCFRLAATLDFELEPRTLKQLRRAAPGLQRIAGERIHEELLRFLACLNSQLAVAFHNAGVCEAIWSLDDDQWDSTIEEWCAARPADEVLPRSPASALSVLSALLYPQAQDQREKLVERVKLSRQQLRFLEGWWAGRDLLQSRSPEEWNTRGIYALYKTAGESLPHLLEFAQLFPYPLTIPPDLADRILAAHIVEFRSDPLPITGRELCQYWSREPGPWLGPLIKELETAWACRECNDIPALLEHSARFI